MNQCWGPWHSRRDQIKNKKKRCPLLFPPRHAFRLGYLKCTALMFIHLMATASCALGTNAASGRYMRHTCTKPVKTRYYLVMLAGCYASFASNGEITGQDVIHSRTCRWPRKHKIIQTPMNGTYITIPAVGGVSVIRHDDVVSTVRSLVSLMLCILDRLCPLLVLIITTYCYA